MKDERDGAVFVSGSGTLVRALLAEGLVDELLVYLAPRLIGQGRAMAAFGPLVRLEDAIDLQMQSVTMVGEDLRVIARLRGRDVF